MEGVYSSGEPLHAREWRIGFDPGDGDQQVFYLDFDVLPRCRDDGTVYGVLIQQTDVTERVRQRQRAQADADEAQQRYQAAHDVVVELQEALLPAGLPVLPEVDLAARYLVAGSEQSAGGDRFDVRPLPGNRVALVVGDVVGHGVVAAAVMSQLRAVLGDALDTTEAPGPAVERLERFAASLPGARSATVVVAVLDPATGALAYLTRGHPAPLLVGADGRSRYLLASGGGPLGSDPGGPTQHAVLEPGDAVVLFSDGLVERPDRAYTEGLDQLARITEAAASGRLWPTEVSDPSAVERVCADSVEMLTRHGHDDDVTILTAALQPTTKPLDIRTYATPGNLVELRGQVRDWLAALRIEPSEQLALEMATGEAVDNAVEHGLDRSSHCTPSTSHWPVTGGCTSASTTTVAGASPSPRAPGGDAGWQCSAP